MYEGKPIGTPDAGAFWRVISEHKVVTLFTAPTTFRAIKREDPQGLLVGKYDLSAFRALFLAGERLDPDTLAWAQNLLKVPVLDHWWQTETGWPICANTSGPQRLPVKPGSPGKAMPGWDVQVVDGRQQINHGEIGALVCKLPPSRTLPTSGIRALSGRTDQEFPASTRPATPAIDTEATSTCDPHRRRDQRGGASPLDRRDGGDAGSHPMSPNAP